MQTLEGDYVVTTNDPAFARKAADRLREVGVVVLRGLASDGAMNELNGRVARILKSPAISGSIGYYMKDPNKKMYDGLLIGKPAVDVLTSHALIDVIEAYHGAEIVMTEAFLKHDFGNEKVYFPYHTHTGRDRVPFSDGAFGCGAILYLHDTDVGAFCYCPGTHHWNSPKGSDPKSYPADVQAQIRSGLRRVSGKSGDVVIFDSRGFHGPEQPVPTARTVIITDYAPLQCIKDGALKTGLPVVATDLTGLDQRQLRLLGVGMKSAAPIEKYHIHSFNATAGFKVVQTTLELWFTLLARLEPLRGLVRMIRGRRLAADVRNDG